jgi:hypothetical protein
MGSWASRAWKVYESARNIGFALRHQRLFGEARRRYEMWLSKARGVFGEEPAVCRKFEEEIVLLNAQERKWVRCNGEDEKAGKTKGEEREEEEKGWVRRAVVGGGVTGLRVRFERCRRLEGLVLLGVLLMLYVYVLRWAR